ncbi:MAG: chromosome segregation protein SMC [Fluviicoccus sp.]|uniref:chromosome segregation protein SMC n=1 Tax=Fluviicoccus sp. TaxID=2003552 RepID=UPI0027227402|nr:chromosome segregation protein SMC [Fluviicoccus sp.]MDO8331814.1 chromosome segregation protein SMC [Fluviicoccus sp.]
MRLKSIKLAGFKSFVDPTTVPFPSNLTAIVGPNGCGKSNVIDAVRWVMGESSARYLRGESMADVIFNGSTTRKPVGQASIELIFDNQDGTLAGEYGRYAEIAVRRQVSREGKSDYYLNGSRCRRKDITDIFLGTGLGPRSYAIIEQGMISRLIEARPEELRHYIEEAAGISRYKERRKETETRLANTRDNLSRLNDIRDELSRQLAHLQKQADAAEKFRRFKAEERETKAQLFAWRWQHMHGEQLVLEQEIQSQAEALASALQQQQGLEESLTAARESEELGHQAVLESQNQLHAVRNAVGSVDQQIRHQTLRREQLGQQIANLQQRCLQTGDERTQDEMELENLLMELETLQPALEESQARHEEALFRVESGESALQQLQSRLETCQREVSSAGSRVQVGQGRILALEQGLMRAQERRLKLTQDLGQYATDELLHDVSAQQEELAMLDQLLQETQLQLEQLGDRITAGSRRQQELARQLHVFKTEQQQLQGRLSALNALQQAALGRDNRELNAWLDRQGMRDAPRLAEVVRVTPGHESLVEGVLGDALSALMVDDLGQYALEGAPHVMLVESSPLEPFSPGSLAGLMIEPVGADWLAKVRLCTGLTEALQQRHELLPGESLVTPEGYWLGRHWLRVFASKTEESVLARQQVIETLQARLLELAGEVDETQREQHSNAEALQQDETLRGQLQKQLSRQLQERGAQQTRLAKLQAQLTQTQLQAQRVREEMADLDEHYAQDAEALAEARLRHQDDLEVWQASQAQEEDILSRREALREQALQLRQRLQEERAASHRLALELQGCQTRERALRQNLQRSDQHLLQLRQQVRELESEQSGQHEPMAELMMQQEELNIRKVEAEERVLHAESALQEAGRLYREMEQYRHRLFASIEPLRQQLESRRLHWQNIASRQEYLQEQVRELGVAMEDILAGLPPDIDETLWQSRLEQLAVRISRLGAINLAAIEEYQQQAERKAYLDAQSADLEEAVEKLENAIKHIDRETRTLFMDTYNQVNAGLQHLFPKVFGGGEATLSLVGEDSLNSGVTIMARPPGKKNSTIHLLSGGEKALTALSLVFAIFQLNPAPFCLLDEVDAPLDDANVGRFCRLVEEMAQKVQFIYITHNKIAMAMAQQLMGVTMHEPGVSRLVAVDVEQAAALAAA